MVNLCSGQHISHIAPKFPNLMFLPSKYPGKPNPAASPQKLDDILRSIDAYCKNTPNVLPAVYTLTPAQTSGHLKPEVKNRSLMQCCVSIYVTSCQSLLSKDYLRERGGLSALVEESSSSTVRSSLVRVLLSQRATRSLINC